MSNVARVAGQAANTLTKPLEVEDVFSTYLYTGTGSTQTITNGIDLAGEGGLVWVKWRSGAVGSGAHVLVDTERGVNYWLSSSATSAQNTTQNSVTAFNSNGFSIVDAGGKTNYSGDDYASWTFRKAPKFFDVVTFTGTGSYLTNIPHNLGVAPGMIIIKRTNSTSDWGVWHRGTGGSGDFTGLSLNATTASAQQSPNSSQYFTDTYFKPTYVYDDTNTTMNVNGGTYVAYLFAHNDGDGEFGPDGDADIIKCGSYTGTGSAGNNVDLGFEPQWLMIKRTNSTGNWQIADVMRGMPNNGGAGAYQRLSANLSNAEVNGQEGPIPTSTGFVLNSTSIDTNGSGSTYIYIAIRRGTAVPTSATEVFAVTTQSGSTPPAHDTGFVTDFSLRRENALSSASVIHAVDRLRGKPYLTTEGTNSETNLNNNTWDFMDGWFGATSNDSNKYAWSWKRAPKYMDVVAYTGDGVAGRTVSHNLGVAPEMIWVKNRTSGVQSWRVYNSALGATKVLTLNQTDAAFSDSAYWNNTEPTSSVFSLGTSSSVNDTSAHIAYLFASLDGISKVGSYTGNGSVQNIDCGFSSGARLVLIKKSSGTGGWVFMDTERGIASGDESYLYLNETYGSSLADLIDPYSGGFATGANGTYLNASGSTYIFYAIA